VIFHPKFGQQVRIHYAKRGALFMPYHGQTGVVRIVANGRGVRGPRNVGVQVGDQLVVVPRGNLVATDKAPAVTGAPPEVGA